MTFMGHRSLSRMILEKPAVVKVDELLLQQPVSIYENISHKIRTTSVRGIKTGLPDILCILCFISIV